MQITDNYVFFWNGIYSQWHMTKMVIDGVEYNSCEQYMMHQKALVFGDLEISAQIMMEENPKQQKRFGRMIRNFDKTVWDKRCLSIVYKGNLAKFSQNPELKEQMLETGDKIFVEASPLDNIWGIGLAEDADNINDPGSWLGLNLLGQALTLVKQELKTL